MDRPVGLERGLGAGEERWSLKGPLEEHGKRGVRFTGQGHYERLLTGSTVSQFGMVAVDRNHGELTQHLFFEIKGFAAA
jgi:hypothetical protein